VTYAWLDADSAAIPETARALLGWHLRANGVTVRLTEVEAYSGLGDDPASHAHRGRTNRNAVMFGPPGHLYVYQIYGMHFCANIVCAPEGEASAVLLRAGAVIDGLSKPAAENRNGTSLDLARQRRPAARNDNDLAAGPAKLMQVLALDKGANGTSVIDGTGPMTITPPPGPVPAELIEAGPRVGVTSAHDVAWRFWIKGDPSVSAYRRHAPRRR
jgi:DNA-3-methyladenine glycosylase